MTEWQTAAQVPMLQILFTATPPPLPRS